MRLMKIALVFGAATLVACGGGEEYDETQSESDWVANGGDKLDNGEPTCVTDVCAVLDMYKDCVADHPVTSIDAATAAYVERQCEGDDGRVAGELAPVADEGQEGLEAQLLVSAALVREPLDIVYLHREEDGGIACITRPCPLACLCECPTAEYEDGDDEDWP